jgi:hypothetical protein
VSGTEKILMIRTIAFRLAQSSLGRTLKSRHERDSSQARPFFVPVLVRRSSASDAVVPIARRRGGLYDVCGARGSPGAKNHACPANANAGPPPARRRLASRRSSPGPMTFASAPAAGPDSKAENQAEKTPGLVDFQLGRRVICTKSRCSAPTAMRRATSTVAAGLGLWYCGPPETHRDASQAGM